MAGRFRSAQAGRPIEGSRLFRAHAALTSRFFRRPPDSLLTKRAVRRGDFSHRATFSSPPGFSQQTRAFARSPDSEQTIPYDEDQSDSVRPDVPARGAACFRSGQQPSPEVVKEFDKDGDGKLNEEERKAARDAREKQMLEKYDADKDGKLSDEERKTAREAMRAEHEKKMLEKYDKDGDGKLSDEERKAMVEAGDGPRRRGLRRDGGPRPDGPSPEGGPAPKQP
jgi:Ca2+-binding EF-hand superfamily protein